MKIKQKPLCMSETIKQPNEVDDKDFDKEL